MSSTFHDAAPHGRPSRLPLASVIAIGVIAIVAFELFISNLARKFSIKERKP